MWNGHCSILVHANFSRVIFSRIAVGIRIVFADFFVFCNLEIESFFTLTFTTYILIMDMVGRRPHQDIC